MNIEKIKGHRYVFNVADLQANETKPEVLEQIKKENQYFLHQIFVLTNFFASHTAYFLTNPKNKVEARIEDYCNRYMYNAIHSENSWLKFTNLHGDYYISIPQYLINIRECENLDHKEKAEMLDKVRVLF